MPSVYVPNRGDVVWIDLDPQAGHEQAGRRPAVIVSPLSYNQRIALTLICPITSRIKGYPFEVRIPVGLQVNGVILADQVKSLDWRARNAQFFCTLPEHVVDDVLAMVRTLL